MSTKLSFAKKNHQCHSPLVGIANKTETAQTPRQKYPNWQQNQSNWLLFRLVDDHSTVWTPQKERVESGNGFSSSRHKFPSIFDGVLHELCKNLESRTSPTGNLLASHVWEDDDDDDACTASSTMSMGLVHRVLEDGSDFPQRGSSRNRCVELRTWEPARSWNYSVQNAQLGRSRITPRAHETSN